MVGPPGTGKSMLAQRIPAILPPLTRAESLETTRIYSAMGLLPDGDRADGPSGRCARRTTRRPRRRWSAAGPFRGRAKCRWRTTGSCFSTSCRSSAGTCWRRCASRSEAGEVTVARVHGSVKFPARFMLVAAMNPTASGYAAKRMPARPRRATSTWPSSRGPLLDRIDIHVGGAGRPVPRADRPPAPAPTARRCASR